MYNIIYIYLYITIYIYIYIYIYESQGEITAAVVPWYIESVVIPDLAYIIVILAGV